MVGFRSDRGGRSGGSDRGTDRASPDGGGRQYAHGHGEFPGGLEGTVPGQPGDRRSREPGSRVRTHLGGRGFTLLTLHRIGPGTPPATDGTTGNPALIFLEPQALPDLTPCRGTGLG